MKNTLCMSLKLYINPEIEQKKAKKLFGDIDIKLSTRKNEKYMLLNPKNNKYIFRSDIL